MGTMPLPYEEYTIEELEAESVRLKLGPFPPDMTAAEIRVERIAIKQAIADKADVGFLSQRLRMDISGLSPATVRELLEESRKTPPRPGDVVVTPETGVFTQSTEAPEVGAASPPSDTPPPSDSTPANDGETS